MSDFPATTATKGVDFEFFDSEQVTWDDGDDSPKAVAIQLLQDSIYEPESETIELNIASVTHPDMRGIRRQTTTFTIIDDGDAGVLASVA